jgi:hypothetical protein
MTQKIALAASLLMTLAGAAQAQSCSCDSSSTTTRIVGQALADLLSNKMVCASVGNEAWQEWHNGSGSGGGPVVDYKLGPGDPRDPSTAVGNYTVNTTASTVTYNYGAGGGTYTYDVCLVSNANSYTFCGSSYGGRNITGARIGGSGLTPCNAVSNVVQLTTKDTRTIKIK